jgi:hypothetical protein
MSEELELKLCKISALISMFEPDCTYAIAAIFSINTISIINLSYPV